MGPDVTMRGFWNLTDVTLADEDTKLIPTDKSNRAIPGNLECMWLNLMGKFVSNASGAIFSGQIFNKVKWFHKVAKFAPYPGGPIWCSNLEPMQVTPSCGQLCN